MVYAESFRGDGQTANNYQNSFAFLELFGFALNFSIFGVLRGG